MKDDDIATLERAETLLRERGFLGCAAGCIVLRHELADAQVQALAALILSAQAAMLEVNA